MFLKDYKKDVMMLILEQINTEHYTNCHLIVPVDNFKCL